MQQILKAKVNTLRTAKKYWTIWMKFHRRRRWQSSLVELQMRQRVSRNKIFNWTSPNSCWRKIWSCLAFPHSMTNQSSMLPGKAVSNISWMIFNIGNRRVRSANQILRSRVKATCSFFEKCVYREPSNGCNQAMVKARWLVRSPELIKAAVLKKLCGLSKIQPKEPKKLYDMLDILLEIQALKEDDKYQAQLSYFDSSEGVLPIVHKLPYNLQEKWVSRAATYKQNNDDCFPPFSVFVSYISEIAKIKNDPALSCTTFSNKKSNRATMPAVSVKKTNVTKKESSQQGFRCPIHKANPSLADCRAFHARSVSERKKILKDNRICYKCCSATHKALDCRVEVKCSEIGPAPWRPCFF